jgi:hypothetical protein
VTVGLMGMRRNKMTANKEVLLKEEERDFDVDIKSVQERVDSFEQELLIFLEPFIGWDAAAVEAEEMFIKYEDEIKDASFEGNHDVE